MNRSTTEMEVQTDSDENLVLNELVERCSPTVLGNWFLAGIIEAAPTPKAADEYIGKLGWPNELAQRVRKGVRLHDACRKVGDGVWNALKVSSRRPRDLFSFGSETSQLHFSKNVRWSESFRLGGFVAKRDLPLFLREFEVCDDDVSSFDGIIGRIPECGASLPREQAVRQFLIGTTPYRLEGEEARVCVDTVFPHTRFTLPGAIIVETKPLRFYDGWKTFPKLYKLVRIRKQLPDGGRETIWWHMRQDLGPDVDRVNGIMHHVFFERTIPVSPRTEAVLDVRYNAFHDSIHLNRLRYDVNFLRMRFLSEHREKERGRHGELEPSDFPEEKIARAMRELAWFAKRMYGAAPVSIPLERIAGISLVTNPPNQLADLFCE